jgi:hypothetical protein
MQFEAAPKIAVVVRVLLIATALAASCAQGPAQSFFGSGGASGGGGSCGPSTGNGGANVASTTAGSGGASGASTTAGSGGASPCQMCVTSAACGVNAACGQFGGDSYCAPDCSDGQSCAAGSACMALSSIEGNPEQLCIPITNPCGGSSSSATSSGPGSGDTTSSGPGATSSATSGGDSGTCGVLDGPNVTASCTSCTKYHMTCQQNGCYGDYWCNTSTLVCQPSPGGNCGSGSGATSTSSTTGATTSAASGAGGSPGGPIGPSGGTLATLSFAIVGDTRPPSEDDTAGYPTAVATQTWQDVQNFSPRPPFAITTGDYQFANPSGSQSAPQLQLYLTARASFSNVVFAAMGNHECTGATDSNCGSGNADGITANYTNFLNMMLAPINQTKPYYSVDINASNGSWTAKFVFIAANAWDSAQSSWLTSTMAQPTTYTFVIRHEENLVTTTPGVSPSLAIINQYPYTQLIIGHTHTYERIQSDKEVVVGNGGAPLSGSVDYGYVIATQLANGNMQFSEYDYATNGMNDQWNVAP